MGDLDTRNIPPYYSAECEAKRNEFMNCLNLYRNEPSDIHRVAMIHARRAFKNSVRSRKTEYDRERTDRLMAARHTDAKLFWTLLKGNKRKAGVPNISTAQLYNHFLALHEHDNYDDVENDVDAYFNDYDGSDLDIHVFDQLNVDITIEEILYIL